MYRLPFDVPILASKLHGDHKILSIGSCFAQEIGAKLIHYKLNALINPFGTIFNPISISQILNDHIDENNNVKHEDVYYHWQSHSKLSALSIEDLNRQILSTRKSTQAYLQTTDWLIITLGSAWIYENKENSEIVANCHKQPSKIFNKRLLKVEEIIDSLKDSFQRIFALNPKLQVLMSVSPVRHAKDGLIENNRSKARLIEAVHELVLDGRVQYFPAYELLVDQLRDYRFYAADGVHPNDESVNYVWDRLKAVWFDAELIKQMEFWDDIMRDINHKPRHPSSKSHQNFLRNLIQKLESWPYGGDMSEEINQLKGQLAKD